jgi:hypothetical protein
MEADVTIPIPRGEASTAYGVVMNLLCGLEDKGHCVVMDNYFCSIPLFEDLARKGIYAIGTVCSNRIGLPQNLKNTKSWKRCEQGNIEWAMHESRSISCVMWKDKRPVLLLSIHAIPIGFPCVPIAKVPRRNGAVRDKIPTSPVLLEYTTFMRGVDVADQLRTSYSSQTRSHKWWHRVFWALVDITEVNMYIMYLDRCKQGPNLVAHPMTYLKFKTTLCEALLLGWIRQNEVYNEALTHRPSIHMPSHSSIKRVCIHCKIHTPHTYCYKCGFKFMCLKEGCFQAVHEVMNVLYGNGIMYFSYSLLISSNFLLFFPYLSCI